TSVGTNSDLVSVWGSGSTDDWAADGTSSVLWHWDGTNWLGGESGSGLAVGRVWGSGPNDVWTIGWSSGKPEQILRWNGTSWSRWPSSVRFDNIWGSGSNDLWLGAGGLLEHWDGAGWSAWQSGAGLTAVGGASATDRWA